MTKSDLIHRVYDWFSRGEAAPILEAFDPAIEFRLADGHPYHTDGKPWRGHEAVTKNFFLRAGPEWSDWKCNVQTIEEHGDLVVVEGRYSGVYKPTGRTLDAQVCHLWRFREGKIASFHQYVDTAHLRAVMGRS
jgi:uncharacterized protein